MPRRLVHLLCKRQLFPAMVLVLLTLVIGVSLALSAHANHSNCTWRRGPKSPAEYGYKPVSLSGPGTANSSALRSLGPQFCAAEHNLVDPVQSTMEWTCLGPNDRDVSVANWNMIGHLALEFATPCGDDGWFLNSYGICLGSSFALCLQPAQDCYYVDDEDDYIHLVQRQSVAQNAGHLVLVGSGVIDRQVSHGVNAPLLVLVQAIENCSRHLRAG
ncbi:hypothetical protein BDZ90DRAFT_44700 [Jaminaea rosea]|uniref:Uncharacterized protein n=1 Tax=Jaminaea rosea TaxID=1569628 RepID=A0A316URY3_9BASI|nr:hypothetical protein BDZ90DRAFT_44700 [Jaminaea rosea]PWN26633.1 hypothetical protein BDZ90DRAFT_44700 [Jaminaea rosea]